MREQKTACSGKGNGLRLGLYRCPKCGTKLEIFSDEVKVRCYKCGDMVYRQGLTPCIDWCVSARECGAETSSRRCNHVG